MLYYKHTSFCLIFTSDQPTTKSLEKLAWVLFIRSGFLLSAVRISIINFIIIENYDNWKTDKIPIFSHFTQVLINIANINPGGLKIKFCAKNINFHEKCY